MFAPLAPLLAAVGQALPGVDALNALAARVAPGVRVGEGRRLRFVPPDRAPLSYEERIFATGEVVTRPDNWHDFFNALVWMRFPQAKRALNALHVREMRRAPEPGVRGPRRDAATQFDESGAIVASADRSLSELLVRRRWKELFWERRAEVCARMRFLVFGHGLYDALRAPFYRICGRAALVDVPQAVIDGDVADQCACVDGIIAQRFDTDGWYPRPGALLALPLLGIPGVTPENACGPYYDDTEQFRPLPPHRARDLGLEA